MTCQWGLAGKPLVLVGRCWEHLSKSGRKVKHTAVRNTSQPYIPMTFGAISQYQMNLPKSDRLMSVWYIDTKLHETLLRHTLWWAWQANSWQRLQTRLQRPADITKSPLQRCGKPKNKPSWLEVIGYYGLPLFGLIQNDPKGCWMGWFMALGLLDYCWRKHLQSAIDKA